MWDIKTKAKPLRKHVLANVNIVQSVRVQAAESHVLPAGEYGAAIWPTLTATGAARYNRTVMDIYRRINGALRAPKNASMVIKLDARVL